MVATHVIDSFRCSIHSHRVPLSQDTLLCLKIPDLQTPTQVLACAMFRCVLICLFHSHFSPRFWHSLIFLRFLVWFSPQETYSDSLSHIQAWWDTTSTSTSASTQKEIDLFATKTCSFSCRLHSLIGVAGGSVCHCFAIAPLKTHLLPEPFFWLGLLLFLACPGISSGSRLCACGFWYQLSLLGFSTDCLLSSRSISMMMVWGIYTFMPRGNIVSLIQSPRRRSHSKAVASF